MAGVKARHPSASLLGDAIIKVLGRRHTGRCRDRQAKPSSLRLKPPRFPVLARWREREVDCFVRLDMDAFDLERSFSTAGGLGSSK
jgi:hypothetical protein